MATFGQFELIEPILIASEETWLAREQGSERTLLLHKFSPRSGIRERLLTMKPHDLLMLLGAGDENGVCFVVTPDTPELRNFRQWLDQRTSARFDGEQTVIATPRDPQRDIPTVVKPAIQSSPPAAHVPSPAPPQPEPGEFTRMFAVPAVQTPAPVCQPQPQSAPTEPGAPKAAPQEPSEFTRMFQAAAPPKTAATSEPPSPIKAPNEPGDFTKFFGNPLSASPLTDAPNEPLEANASTFAEPRGEFTRHFGVLDQSSEAVQSRPLQGAGATGLFSVPDPSPQRTPATQAPAGPSEYTRVFSRPVQDTAESQDAKPKSEPVPLPSAQPAKNYIALVIILAVLAVAAVALVLFFVFRP